MRYIFRLLAILFCFFLFFYTCACSPETKSEIQPLNTNDIPPTKAISTAYINAFHDEVWGGPELYNNNRIEVRSFTLESFAILSASNRAETVSWVGFPSEITKGILRSLKA